MSKIPKPEDTRRPDVPIHEVTLADGRKWGLARPSIRLRPMIVAGEDADGRPTETIAVRTTVAYPLEIQRLMETMRIALAAGLDVDQYEALFNLAAALLRRAHDIDLATTAALLSVDIEHLAQFAREVIAIAFGPPPATADREEGGHE